LPAGVVYQKRRGVTALMPATSCLRSELLGAVTLGAHVSPESVMVKLGSEAWRSRPSLSRPRAEPPSATRPRSGISTKEALQQVTGCAETTDSAGTTSPTVSGMETSYSMNCSSVSVTTASLSRVSSRDLSCGRTTAFQPRGSFCAARMLASSASLAASPSCPTSGRQASSVSVSTSVYSAGERTASSCALVSSEPLSPTRPAAASTVADPLTKSDWPEARAEAGSRTLSRSGAAISYSCCGGKLSASVPFSSSDRCSARSVGRTLAFQPPGSACAETMLSSSSCIWSG
jgi:hypothetical protein